MSRTAPVGSIGEPTTVWRNLGDFLFGMIRLNAVMVLLMAPLIVVCVGVRAPLRSFPTFIAALWSVTPGVAVAFAAFRDCPAFGHSVLRRGLSSDRETAAAVAKVYWGVDDGEGMVRPCCRTLRRLWRRTLIASAPLTVSALVLCVDAVWAATTPMGVYVVPALATTVVLLLAAWPVVVVVITEVPHARVSTLLRLALVVVVRRWYLSLLNLLVMAAMYLGLVAQPFLMMMLGNGFLLHLVWANARWMALPMLAAADGAATS